MPTTTVRFSEVTRRQLTALAAPEHYGSVTATLAVAIDRIWRDTVSTIVHIHTIDTEPTDDPYHAQTQGITQSTLQLDPEERRAHVYQRMDQGGEFAETYYGLIVEANAPHCDPNDLREFLTNEEGQTLLRLICDGHSTSSASGNQRGRLTEDAQEALFELEREMARLGDDDYWQIWTAEEHLLDFDLGEWLPEGASDTLASATDEELESVAEKLEQECALTHTVIVGGTLLEALREMRDEQREALDD